MSTDRKNAKMAEETRRELRRRLEKRAIEENWPAKDHDILEGSFKDAGNIWIHLHKLSKDEKNELSFWRICDCNKQHGKEEPQNLEKKTSLSEAFAGITWADGKIKALAKYYFMVQCDVPFPINKTFVSDVVAEVARKAPASPYREKSPGARTKAEALRRLFPPEQDADHSASVGADDSPTRGRAKSGPGLARVIKKSVQVSEADEKRKEGSGFSNEVGPNSTDLSAWTVDYIEREIKKVRNKRGRGRSIGVGTMRRFSNSKCWNYLQGNWDSAMGRKLELG
ncbi:hypothetical protein BU26DRAFT_507929 [Trematosphaeria pertusa]|uniref:Uncharacterized protein n=1 Tax=Trematosphaeria pertusa TaxID=390896 RepID=A0A6A6I7K5_9PLEO|nr:uncharacterized protein BU26DRAFT_507929 [Trematosphaeria pertusa]KAF2246336.1 hypothetical protein BU26DRAFT_507929 [Trematosphaeria pertusa]